MIRVEEALKTILGSVGLLSPEEIKLADCLDRVLAQDIHSDSDIPGFDNSAMDGYALKSSDTSGASEDKPKILEVLEDLKAGYRPKKTLKNNQAIRIMTGAPIPGGADAVIMVENTERGAGVKGQGAGGKGQGARGKGQGSRFVRIFKEVKLGENIRRKGEDIKKEELVIQKGTLLSPAHIGILASLGRPKVKVTRRPRVAVLATGDEVVEVGKKLKPGRLYSSNTYTLYSQVLEAGGIPQNLGIAKDRPQELKAKIKKGLDCDVILTSGGVSVGDYDLVKSILAQLGTDIKFWKVAMRPGKPLVFGKIDSALGPKAGLKGILVFGLPGNPVSSMVSFEVFVRPTILKMLGQKRDNREEVDAVVEEDLKKKKGVRYFLRAQTRRQDGIYLTRTTGPQGSGILKSMAAANSLIILQEEAGDVEKGTRVTARFLD